jgi:hypothetical protein
MMVILLGGGAEIYPPGVQAAKAAPWSARGS